MFLLYAQWEHFDHMACFEEHCNYMSKTEQLLEQISNDCQLLWVVTYEAHVEVTIQTPQKCSHQSQIEHMLWVHFKCVLYAITMKSLGSVRVCASSPINPGRFSNQCHTSDTRYTPTLPR